MKIFMKTGMRRQMFNKTLIAVAVDSKYLVEIRPQLHSFLQSWEDCRRNWFLHKAGLESFEFSTH